MSELYSRTDRSSREAAELREDSRAFLRRLGEQEGHTLTLRKQLDTAVASLESLASQQRVLLETVEGRVKALEERAGSIEERVQELSSLSNRIDEMQSALQAFSVRLDTIAGHLSTLSLKEDEGRTIARELDKKQTQRNNALSEAVQAASLRAEEGIREVAGQVKGLAESMDAFSEDLNFQVNNVKNLVAGGHLFREYELQRRKELETMAEDLQEGRGDTSALLAPMELRLRRLEDLLLDHLSRQSRPASPSRGGGMAGSRAMSRAGSVPLAGNAIRPASAAPWII